MLNECSIRLHVIHKFDILLRYIDIIFCEMNCQFANMRGSYFLVVVYEIALCDMSRLFCKMHLAR